MNNKTSAALGAAFGVAVTVAITKLVNRSKEPVTAEEEAAYNEQIQIAYTNGWFNGRDSLLEQLSKITGIRWSEADATTEIQ